MSLNASKSRLSGVTRELSLQWAQTRTCWRDAKADEFEQKYIDELIRYADKTTQVMEKLEELLKKIRSDCE